MRRAIHNALHFSQADYRLHRWASTSTGTMSVPPLCSLLSRGSRHGPKLDADSFTYRKLGCSTLAQRSRSKRPWLLSRLGLWRAFCTRLKTLNVSFPKYTVERSPVEAVSAVSADLLMFHWIHDASCSGSYCRQFIYNIRVAVLSRLSIHGKQDPVSIFYHRKIIFCLESNTRPQNATRKIVK